MRRYKVTLTTAADGTATGYAPKTSGNIHSVQYVKPGTNSFADGVDFTITAEATGENIWTEQNVNASAVRYPRAATHTQAGAAALFAAGGTPVQDRIAIGGDRVKIAIAQGGNAKTGAFHILVD
ncbi:hypothetical protein GCM10017620_24690 [Brevundimonas intermedia]|uniref:Head decoration protein n=1 Tax=Brevundimonas intermedia TaxID=74315 RepID=A0ABQ5TCK6_9CAUL|nr:hypothetical protein [Brevundimonas intermedia]GLK49496.1 hypothetical protein GCM10017620_24690 [Brevundimonas intermedia]